MKLTSIDESTPEESDELIRNISRSSNSQNKVSDADFFASHPFHRRMEQISRHLFAPASEGAQYETKWFYERARGQYLQEQMRLTPAKKKQFELQHPKNKVIKKTDLAKVQNTWRGFPQIVSKGAQTNFNSFAEYIDEQWNTNEEQFNERYFQTTVALILLFQYLEKTIPKQPWYEGGYRANIIYYTLAQFALEDEAVTKWAFNAAFERICLSRFLGYPTGEYLEPESWRCSMIWAATMGLPLSLEGVGAVLGLEKQKLTEGKDLIKYFCQPCTPTKTNGQRTRNHPFHAPDKWAMFKKYNIRDVETKMGIQQRLAKFPVPAQVWEEYQMDQEINDRGVRLDMELVAAAIEMDTRSRTELTKTMKEITELENPNSVQQMKWNASSSKWMKRKKKL